MRLPPCCVSWISSLYGALLYHKSAGGTSKKFLCGDKGVQFYKGLSGEYTSVGSDPGPGACRPTGPGGCLFALFFLPDRRARSPFGRKDFLRFAPDAWTNFPETFYRQKAAVADGCFLLAFLAKICRNPVVQNIFNCSIKVLYFTSLSIFSIIKGDLCRIFMLIFKRHYDVEKGG